MAKKITMEQIGDTVNAYISFSCTPLATAGFQKVREGYVFDENQSVVWNREEVKRKNAEYAAEVKRLNSEKNKLYTQFNNEVLQYIKQELNCSDAYAEKVRKAVEDISQNMTPDDEYWMRILCEDVCEDLVQLIKERD